MAEDLVSSGFPTIQPQWPRETEENSRPKAKKRSVSQKKTDRGRDEDWSGRGVYPVVDLGGSLGVIASGG